MRNDKKRQEHLRRQKTLGLLIGLIGIVVSLLIFDPCGLLLTAFGVYIYFTDEVVLVDEYYWSYVEDLEKSRKRRRRSK